MNNDNIQFLKPFIRGLPIVLLGMVVSILMTKKYLSYVLPMYESTAKLRLADTHEGVPNSNLFKDFDVFASANKIGAEIEVLKSALLLEKTLDKLNFSTEIYRKGRVQSVELFNDSPINVEAVFNDDTNYDKRFLLNIISPKDYKIIIPENNIEEEGHFGVPFRLKNGYIIISYNQKNIKNKKNIKIIDQYEIEFLSKEKLLNKVRKNLDITSVDKDIPIIRVNYKSNSSEKAAIFVNTHTETYIQDYIENKFVLSNTAVDFLKRELMQAKEKLTNVESKIENYRNKENIIDIPKETETDLRKIAQLKIQKNNLKMNLNAVKSLNNYITSVNGDFLDLATNFEAFNDLLSTEIIKKMKELQAEKKELLISYTPEHEKIMIINSKIKDLADYQTESIKNTQNNLQIKYDEISREIIAAEQEFIGQPQKEKLLNIMNRDFSLYEKNYIFLNEKKIEAEIAKAAKVSFHKIIEPGKVSKHAVSPVRSVIIPVAAIIGMLGSILLIYLVHFAKAKVNNVYTIEKNSSIPIAFTTPFIKDEKEIQHHFLENILKMKLKAILVTKKIICITSYDNPEQHTFHAENIIKALQLQQKKVLIIDVSNTLYQLETENYLSCSTSEILRFDSSCFHNMILEKIQSVDICVINNQAIKQGKLPLLLLTIAHQNLFVLDSRKTAAKNIVNIELIKDEYKLNNIHFVLNKEGYNPSIFTAIKKLIKIRL